MLMAETFDDVGFFHLRDTDNVGDRQCSPFDRFDWPGAVVGDIRQPAPGLRAAIFGGGKIFGGLSHYAAVAPPRTRLQIAWGVSTVQKLPISLRYAKARRRMDLVGSRDWGDERYVWAPCASCMASGFDAPSAPEHEVVVYTHASKTGDEFHIPDHVPRRTNHGGTLDEALAFLASGETVVSNSYHGVFWGLLLGRRVLCVPFSNKFGNYRVPPGYSTAREWAGDLHKAQAAPEMLDLCRSATHDFRARVLDRLAETV